MLPRFSLLIPYTPDGGIRDLIFRWTLARWQALFPDAEIIVGADDTGGPLINRSRMRNNCAKQARTETWLFVDADALIFSPHEFDTVIDLLPGAGMVQYQSVTWLSLPESAGMMSQRPGANLTLPATMKPSDHVLLGLFFAVTRQAYEAVNGFDERFAGWGEEDPSFGCAIRSLVGPVRRVPYTMYHLHHPRGEEHDLQSKSFQRNYALGSRYRSAESDEAAMRGIIGEAPSWQADPPTV